MKHRRLPNPTSYTTIALALVLAGCGSDAGSDDVSAMPTADEAHDDHHAGDGGMGHEGDMGHEDDGHGHDDGHAHDEGATHDDEGEGHGHEETPLGTARVGDLEVEFAQGHGAVEAGKEGHLVVKLPYSDGGETVVRAWIGTEDRLQSYVGKAEYAPSHDDYDVHVTAPDPLPEDARWWVELERPDGTRLVGSVEPQR